MEITKGRLKKIIKEEMDLLIETGDVYALSEAEKKVFQVILEKMQTKDLEKFGLIRK